LLLYYITDRTAFAADEATRRRLLLKKISEAASAGVDYIQLREKDLSTRDLESLAREVVSAIVKLRAENRELRTALLINSRTDVARAVGAEGVHLRSEDVSPEEVRTIWKDRGSDKCGSGECGVGTLTRQLSPQTPLIVVSCHSPTDVAQAVTNSATLAVFAPVFEKKDATAAGLAALHRACSARIPVFALGGVTLANAQSCLEAGAAGIAGIRLFQENNVADIVRRLRKD
jgi:thiamine-phosphate pyrophosphorylase